MYTFAISQFVQGFKILRDLRTLLRGTQAAAGQREIRRVIKGLRELFFFDNQVSSALHRIGRSENLSAGDLDRARRGLELSNVRIGDALTDVENFADNPPIGLPIETINSLRGLYSGKMDVRFAIEVFIEAYAEPKDDLERVDAREQACSLLELIGEFNSQLQEADEAVRLLLR